MRGSDCGENNPHVVIGKDNYYLSADGLLMPARKDQAPPDLRYFKPSAKPYSSNVIAGLDPAIPIVWHDRALVSGMAGSSPAMTIPCVN